MKIRLTAAAVLAVGLLAGCADVIDGSGSSALSTAPGGSPSGDFPSASGGPGSASAPTPTPLSPSSSDTGASVATPCPRVSYPYAKVSFDCITTGFTAHHQSAAEGVWPLTELKEVEASTGWVVEEGAGHWGPLGDQTLGDIAYEVRQRMIDQLGYGKKPSYDTIVAKNTTVAGVAAHLLQTTITLNPAWAKSKGTAVKQEKLWIVALQVGADDVSLWYASVPDLVKSLWAEVPAAIDSIAVG